MNVPRLLELATLMDRVATEESNALAQTLTLDGLFIPEYVSQAHAAALQEVHPPTDFDLSQWCVIDKCGASACAFGYAMFHPPFVAEGLRGKRFANDYVAPEYNGAVEMDAAEAFFDLSAHDACSLFLPTRYPFPGRPSAAEVAERVRELVETGEIASAEEDEEDEDEVEDSDYEDSDDYEVDDADDDNSEEGDDDADSAAAVDAPPPVAN